MSTQGAADGAGNFRGSAEWGLGGEESGASPAAGLQGETARGGAVTVAKSLGGLAQRSPGEGPEQGPSPAGGGAGGRPRPRRARGSVRGEAGPALPAPAAVAAWAPAGSAHNTSHVCATHPPSARAGGSRAGGERGPEGGGSGGGPGTGSAARTRPGPTDVERWRAVGRGGACREGRGLLLGLAQETGRGGRSYRLPVGLLVYSWRGSFNPKGGRAAGKTRSWICELPEREWGGGGAKGGTAAKVPRPLRSWKGPAKDAQDSFVFCCIFVCVGVFKFPSLYSSRSPPPAYTHTRTHTHTHVGEGCSPASLSALKFLKPRMGSPPRRRGLCRRARRAPCLTRWMSACVLSRSGSLPLFLIQEMIQLKDRHIFLRVCVWLQLRK